jgi:hypothetical protein
MEMVFAEVHILLITGLSQHVVRCRYVVGGVKLR